MGEEIFDNFASHCQVWFPHFKGQTRLVCKAANPDALVANLMSHIRVQTQFRLGTSLFWTGLFATKNATFADLQHLI